MGRLLDSENQHRLTDQILWRNRKSYIDLLEQYLRLEIDAEAVVDTFFELHREHNNESEGLPSHPERLEKIEIMSKSEGFCDLIEEIFSGCEALDVEETDDSSGYPLSENRFRKEMSLRLQRLKAYD